MMESILIMQKDILTVLSDVDSDLNHIEETYFCDGGFFWVLTCRMTTSGNDDHGDGGGREDDILVGTCGLQCISNTEAELRRVCISAKHRNKGWGSKLVSLAME